MSRIHTPAGAAALFAAFLGAAPAFAYDAPVDPVRLPDVFWTLNNNTTGNPDDDSDTRFERLAIDIVPDDLVADPASCDTYPTVPGQGAAEPSGCGKYTIVAAAGTPDETTLITGNYLYFDNNVTGTAVNVTRFRNSFAFIGDDGVVAHSRRVNDGAIAGSCPLADRTPFCAGTEDDFVMVCTGQFLYGFNGATRVSTGGHQTCVPRDALVGGLTD